MTEKMNALRNKKGFTLIEMLVVIAIIAVLVAIVIPVVGNSTNKAACATNAANLRSVKAEITTALLTNDETKYDLDKIKHTATNAAKVSTCLTDGVTDNIPDAKKTSDPETGSDVDMYVEYDATTKEAKLYFLKKDNTNKLYINDFATEAAGETTPSSSEG